MDEEKLNELADSIRKLGLLQPLLVCAVEVACGRCASIDGAPCRHSQAGELTRYEIIDGHRRFIATGMAGLHDLPVREFANVEECKYAIMLDATACHEDFTPAEEGFQFLELADKHGWSMEQLQRQFKRSDQYINDRVSMVQKFPDVTQASAERKINWSQARVIMRCSHEPTRRYMIEQAATHGATARTLTYMVDQWRTSELLAEGKPAPHTPEYVAALTPTEEPTCLWCDRADDQTNMATVAVHSYHKRDLEILLDRLGINREGRKVASA